MYFKTKSKPDNSELIGGIVFIGFGAIRLALYLLDKREMRSAQPKSPEANKNGYKEKEHVEVN